MSDKSFEDIRKDNDALLLADIENLRQGHRLDALISFAKAYLGLFARIEDCDDPVLRVHMLANDELATAILAGLVNSLEKTELLSAHEIGQRVLEEEPVAIGFVVLAAIDRLYRTDKLRLLELPDRILQAAIAFQYANACPHEHDWSEELYLQQPHLSSTALRDFWLGVIEHGTDYLPGFNQVYKRADMRDLVKETVLPLLENWQNCRDRSLRELLQMALRFADRDELRRIAGTKLENESGMGVTRRVYWRSTAFMLEPGKHAQALQDYVDRSKERALRLLDFAFNVMQEGEGSAIQLQPMAHARLLRMIAPKFTPRTTRGSLDEIERKVAWLFKRLDHVPAESRDEAMNWLQGVRVMRGTLRYFDALPG